MLARYVPALSIFDMQFTALATALAIDYKFLMPALLQLLKISKYSSVGGFVLSSDESPALSNFQPTALSELQLCRDFSLQP